MEPTTEQRLRRADPMTQHAVDAARDQDWLRATAHSVTRQEARPRQPRALLIGAVAAVAVIAAVIGGAAVVRSGDGATTTTATAPTVTELALPAGDVMQSCIPFSVEALAPMPVAFSGEVAEMNGDEVLIDVDTWYKGGDADQVRLTAPDLSAALLGGTFEFTEGSRYLVTAYDGTVNYCGFSGPWTQEMADAFAAAFGTSG